MSSFASVHLSVSMYLDRALKPILSSKGVNFKICNLLNLGQILSMYVVCKWYKSGMKVWGCMKIQF